jgi:prepilin-type processing-associated H-X9-DG protein
MHNLPTLVTNIVWWDGHGVQVPCKPCTQAGTGDPSAAPYDDLL